MALRLKFGTDDAEHVIHDRANVSLLLVAAGRAIQDNMLARLGAEAAIPELQDMVFRRQWGYAGACYAASDQADVFRDLSYAECVPPAQLLKMGWT